MKISSSGTMCIAIALVSIHIQCYGQKTVIGARHELTVTLGVLSPAGPKNYGADPALLANMDRGYSTEISYTTTLRGSLRLGGWASISKFNGWRSADDDQIYKGASVNIQAIGPSLMYKGWSPKHNLSNRLNFFTVISPGIAKLNVLTMFASRINANSETNPLTVQSLRFTIGFDAGVSYIMTNLTGINLQAGYRYTTADSKIFPDNNYSFLNLRAGLFLRLFKDKRYKYSRL